MRKKDMNVALFPARRGELDPETHQAGGSAQIGTITAVNAAGSLVVELPGDARGPTAARLGVALTAERIQTAIASRQPVVLVFENGDRAQPIIVGLIEALPCAPMIPIALPATTPATTPTITPTITNDTSIESPIIEADVDGRRVRVTAKDEIVLQCGAASVTLRRNGRVVIRGTYVETHSDGTNRIKGGQVQIN